MHYSSKYFGSKKDVEEEQGKTFIYAPGKRYIRLIENTDSEFLAGDTSQKAKSRYKFYLSPEPLQKRAVQKARVQDPAIQSLPIILDPQPLLAYQAKDFKWCHLLDQDLQRMQKDHKVRDLESEYYGKHRKPRDSTFEAEPSREYSYFPAEFDYPFYPAFNTFQIGRLSFVRPENSVEIDSNCISREHCRLKLTKGNSWSPEITTMKLCARRARSCTPLSKLPQELLQNIADYAMGRDLYQIQDKRSRNGTFVRELPSLINGHWVNLPIEVRQGWSYCFSLEDYFFKFSCLINKNSFDLPSKPCGIHQHNSRLNRFLSREVKRLGIPSEHVFVPKQLEHSECWAELEGKGKEGRCDCMKIQLAIVEVKISDQLEHYVVGTVDVRHDADSEEPQPNGRFNKIQTSFEFSSGLSSCHIELNHYNPGTDIQVMSIDADSPKNQVVEIYNDGNTYFWINAMRQTLDFDEIPRKHGMLCYLQGKWFICGHQTEMQFIKDKNHIKMPTIQATCIVAKENKIQIRNTGFDLHYAEMTEVEKDLKNSQKIWTKVHPDGYPLNTKRRYQFRLGTVEYQDHFLLEFVDFHPRLEDEDFNLKAIS